MTQSWAGREGMGNQGGVRGVGGYDQCCVGQYYQMQDFKERIQFSFFKKGKEIFTKLITRG